MAAGGSNSRSGSNKKAQLGLFAGYLLAGLSAVLGLLLLAISLWRPETFQGLRSMASDATAPVGEISAAGRVGTQNFFEAVAGYYEAGSKNAELEREIAIARVRLAEATALEQENERLKAVLGLSQGDTQPVALARLIGSTNSSTRRFAYLAAGRADGVERGMPVTSPMGLVGRVLEVGANTSRVLLLTDTDSVVPVRRATDNVVAFAEGRADGSLRIRLINLGVNPLEEGDIFVTSGAGGLFHPGTAVAMVREITDDGAVGQILSNPAGTDVVAVLPLWQGDVVAEMEEPLEPAEPAESGEPGEPGEPTRSAEPAE